MLRKSHCLFTAGCLASSIFYHVNLVHLVKQAVKLIQKLYVDISRRARKLVLLLVCAITCPCGCWLLHPLFLLAVLSQFAVSSSHGNPYKMGMLNCMNILKLKDSTSPALHCCCCSVSRCSEVRGVKPHHSISSSSLADFCYYVRELRRESKLYPFSIDVVFQC